VDHTRCMTEMRNAYKCIGGKQKGRHTQDIILKLMKKQDEAMKRVCLV